MFQETSSGRTVVSRILIDCTPTYDSWMRTGIQRVVRSIVRESNEAGTIHNVQTIPVIKTKDGFRPLTNAEKKLPRKSGVLERTPTFYQVAAKAICRVAPQPYVRNWLLPEPGHYGIFKLPRKIARLSQKIAKSLPRVRSKILKSDVNIEFDQPGLGDVLLMPDAYWGCPDIWETAMKAKRVGARVAVVIYDLIPITHPQFVIPGAEDSFREYLKHAVEHADILIAISEAVRDELNNQFPILFPQQENFPIVTSFRLGAEFDSHNGTVSKEVQTLFSPTQLPPYLMVSTFDPRKNHSFLLDAFDRFWEHHPDAKLCFVGQRGWMSEHVLDRIEKHSRYQSHLFALHDMNDASLFYCYKNARAVICPSRAEGFGLPVVESLWHGTKTMVSDTPIHREVGRDHCEYFQLDNTNSLLKAMESWESSLASNKIASKTRVIPTTWRESTIEIIGRCLIEPQSSRQIDHRLEASMDAIASC